MVTVFPNPDIPSFYWQGINSCSSCCQFCYCCSYKDASGSFERFDSFRQRHQHQPGSHGYQLLSPYSIQTFQPLSFKERKKKSKIKILPLSLDTASWIAASSCYSHRQQETLKRKLKETRECKGSLWLFHSRLLLPQIHHTILHINLSGYII